MTRQKPPMPDSDEKDEKRGGPTDELPLIAVGIILMILFLSCPGLTHHLARETSPVNENIGGSSSPGPDPQMGTAPP
ncbi:hypothetical protein [Actinomyces bowdenii]|uniref:Uncharacterized protein n=1 Tax=Actinomyces bowdenii TaxID=131109 RepID=A0A3P1V331_9ACTO|nr:hypothetical protein [Actinomyces bowdenii]RRD28584.1 hypothetical protein EII10_08855 [Actinomyces bowdenii]